MKKKILTLSIMILAALSITLTSCDTEPEELCEQDEICEDKSVTTCCTEGESCVYKYNDKEYQEEEIDQLASDLGCTAKRSANYDDDMTSLKTKLKALLEKARKNSN